MADYSNASNYSIQTGPSAKDRQAIKEDPSDTAHMTTHRPHEPMKISREPLAPYDPSESSPMVPISR